VGGEVVDGAATVDGRKEFWREAGAEVGEADAVPVDAAVEEEEAGEFEQGLAAGDVAGAELECRSVLENEQDANLAHFDEFVAAAFTETGGDIPINVADIVTVGITHDLVELHAAATKGGAVAAA